MAITDFIASQAGLFGVISPALINARVASIVSELLNFLYFVGDSLWFENLGNGAIASLRQS